MHDLSISIIGQLGLALKNFGTYSFDDKGPNEVMSIDDIVDDLRKLSPTDAAMVLIEVATSKKHKGRGLQVASTIVCDLQDWDDLFAIPGIDNILNDELPGTPPSTVTPIALGVVRPEDFMKRILGK